MSIKAETAYKLEGYRGWFYAPVVAVLVGQVLVNAIYSDYFLDLWTLNLISTAVGLSAILAYVWFRNLSRYVSFYATMAMEEWRHKSYERYLCHLILEKLKTYPYVPVLIALGIGVAYYILLVNGLTTPIEHSDSNNDFGLIWQIHASILGLVFVTLSFLIGLLNADELNKKIDVGKRLANKLHFKSITVTNTVLTLWVGYTALISTVQPWQESTTVAAFVFLIASIIYLFQNFMTYLFELDLLRALVLGELKANLRKSLGAEIKAKVGHQFFQTIAKDLGIYVGYDMPDAFSRAVPGAEKGQVVDIDTLSLKKFASVTKTTIPVKDFSSGTVDRYKASLIKGLVFDSGITERRETIALIAKEEPVSVDRKVQSIFKVKPFERRKEELAENLKELVDSVIGYLRVSPNKSFEVMEFMGALIDESLTMMREYQIEFSYETSKQLTHLDWYSISRLVYALDDIYKEIYRGGNSELAHRVLTFLSERIYAAIKERNHYLFKEFMGSYVRVYYLSTRSEKISEQTKKELVNSIHRKIEELFKYGLRLDEDEIQDPPELKFYKGVALEVQSIVRQLNKAAIDAQDLEGVKAFSKTLKRTSSTLDSYRDVRILENEVEIQKMDIPGGEALEERERKIVHLQELIDLNKTLEKVDMLSRYALGAWTVELYRRGRVDEAFFAQTLPLYQAGFGDLKSITEAFFEIKKDWRGDQLNLSHWEMEGNADGEVHTIRMDWLTYFYVLTVLRKIPDTLNDELFIYGEGLKEYSSSYLETILKEIEGTIKNIEDNKAKWKPVLPSRTRMVGEVSQEFDDLEKKEKLLELHRRGIKKREEEESEFLANAPIDPETWEEFKKEFHKDYAEHPTLKSMIKEIGVYEDQTNETTEDEEAFGTKTLDFKYHFIKDWYISSFGAAEAFASAMARGEDHRVADELFRHIQQVDPISIDAEIVPRIDLMLSALQAAGYAPNAILVGNWVKMYVLRQSPEFVSKNEGPGNRLQGTYKGVNVYYVQGQELHNKVVVVDLKRIGAFVQKQVKGEPGKEIYLNVRTITDADIDGWIEKDAEVVKKDGVQMSREEIKKYMGERVLLDILQKFDFEVADAEAGRYAEVTDR